MTKRGAALMDKRVLELDLGKQTYHVTGSTKSSRSPHAVRGTFCNAKRVRGAERRVMRLIIMSIYEVDRSKYGTLLAHHSVSLPSG